MKTVLGIHCDNIPWTHDPNVGVVGASSLGLQGGTCAQGLLRR